MHAAMRNTHTMKIVYCKLHISYFTLDIEYLILDIGLLYY